MKNIVKTAAMVALLLGASTPVVRAQSPRLDPSFAIMSAVGPQGSGTAGISDVLRQPDGKLVVSGDFRSINGRPALGVARLLPDGQVDTTFAAPPINGLVLTLALQADSKLLVGGRFTTVGGQSRVGLARLLPTGALDPSFLPPYGGGPPPFAYSNVRKIVLQPGRGILLVGTLIPMGSTGPGAVRAARLLESTGAVDPTFQLPANTTANTVNDVLVLPTGGLVFSSPPNLFNGQPCIVWATGPDGALDPAFVPLPGLNAFSEAYALARDPATGKLYVVRDPAGTGTLALEPLRLLPTGVPDPTFRVAGGFGPSFSVANALAVQPNGRLLLGGDFSVAGGFYGSCRLLPSGGLDPSYDPSRGPGSGVTQVRVLPDGKLLFAGGFTQAGGFALECLARMLDPNVLLAARAGATEADALAAWPVPAREVLHLRLPAGRAARQAALLDALGRVVLRQALASGAAAPALPTAGLAPGGYLLRVDFASGPPAYRRVAVE